MDTGSDKSNQAIAYFDKFRTNVNSQYGEDGILAELLRILDITGGRTVDVGAWDGVKFSNIFELVKRGFDAVMIEAADGKYLALCELAEKYPQITPVKAFVDSENVVALIWQAYHAYIIEVLNIDTDGDDAGIWAATGDLAKVAVIEWNDRGDNKSRAVLDAAAENGYELVARTNSNMIFVQGGLFEIVMEGVK